jgi:replication factor A1
MGAIDDVYADLDADVSESEFRTAVEEKIEQMGGLADEETAALLIAHEMEGGGGEVEAVADVEPGMDEVEFRAQVTRIGDLRSFERDDGNDGRVINVEVADESGAIRLAFWDDRAVAVDDGEIEAGDVLRVGGRPREGYAGVEVHVDDAEIDPDAEIDVPTGRTTIEDLSLGAADVTLRGRVLDVDDEPRTFDRDDGSEGRVANCVLGDETGRVRATCWDERTDDLDAIEPGDSVAVVDGYVRERDGDLELHAGGRSDIDRLDEPVDYTPETDPIESVSVGDEADIRGVVRAADPKRTFDRDDGSEGQVRNVRVQDATDDIRVALWGDKADRDVGPGDEVVLTGVEIQDGWQDDLEASAGWSATLTVLADEGDGPVTGAESPEGDAASGSEARGLGAFEDGETAPDPSGAADAGGEEGSEPVERTGTVVQPGDPVIIDTGDGTVSVETDADPELGEEITVSGPVRDGRLRATEVRRPAVERGD